MCLAIPMRVTRVSGDPDDFTTTQSAIVDADGISKEIRLDVVDRWPEVGDYLIIHAGFAIHTLEEKEAKANIELIRKMAESMPEELLR
ncbi:MAG: HypC/HybG/HupF family hydrogenase formation chaperone [Desulfopila sp.]|nr:HypC/HybG/HupF family hydrogenase formation chaperone [Desulfopila sp.]